MTGAALLAELRAAGFQLEALPGARIAVTPASRMTPEIRERIRAHKAALLEVLERPEVTTPSSCGWCGGPLAPYLVNLAGRGRALLCPTCRRWTLAGGAA